MSLNWNVEQVKDYGNVCYETAKETNLTHGYKKGDRVLKLATSALISAAPVVSIGRITEKNWEKFHSRIAIYEKAFGGLRRDGKGKPIFFTKAEVQQHVGLSTNVETEPDTKWRRWFFANWERECARRG